MTNELVSGNIFIREERNVPKGQVTLSHRHNFDHTTYVPRGAFLIEQLEETGVDEKGAPLFKTVRQVEKRATDGRNWVLIKAGTWHRLTSLEDGSIYHCIYSHRTSQGEIVQEYDGWREALG